VPFLRISVDTKLVTTVATERRDFVTVRLGGTVVDDDYADLSVSAVVSASDRGPEHRTWIDQLPLTAGQCVDIDLVEEAIETDLGKSFGELYPNRSGSHLTTLIDKASAIADIRKCPALRTGYKFAFTSSAGKVEHFSTMAEDHGFSFGVLWTYRHPDRARVSLHSYTLASIENDLPGHYFVRDTVGLGAGVKFRLGP
jgi:hypothetical protein